MRRRHREGAVGVWGKHATHIACALAALVGAASRPASADTQVDSPFRTRPLLLEVRTGFNSATDMLGVMASYDAQGWLGLGVGIGVSPWGEPQYAGAFRWRPIRSDRPRERHHALLLELAWSGGAYRKVDITLGEPCDADAGECSRDPRADFMHWLGGEIAWELRAQAGFSFRLGAGGTFSLDRAGFSCGDSACQNPPNAVVTLTSAVGWAF